MLTNDNVFSLFIGDLSKFCNEAEVERLFSDYGPVLDVKIKVKEWALERSTEIQKINALSLYDCPLSLY